MAYRITKTTDGQHIGTVLEYVEKGQIVTFEDGDVVPIDQIFTADDGSLIACGVNYQITFVLE